MNSEQYAAHSAALNQQFSDSAMIAPSNKRKILFVCYGNICRSPSAQGIFDFLAAIQKSDISFETDSAGTHDFHIGKAPDSRAIRALSEAGLDISTLRGRQFEAEDFEKFDHILVMDQRNLDFLSKICPPQYFHKVELIVNYFEDTELASIPDPFHGEEEDFNKMVDLLFIVCKSLLERLIQCAMLESAQSKRN